jgi:hypothetical protein
MRKLAIAQAASNDERQKLHNRGAIRGLNRFRCSYEGNVTFINAANVEAALKEYWWLIINNKDQHPFESFRLEAKVQLSNR